MQGRSEVESRMHSVHDLCRKHNVGRLWLFGSAVREDFDPKKSDFDFLAEFLPGCSRPWFGEYVDLKDDLQVLFGRSVDIIGFPSAEIKNPYLRKVVQSEDVLLYAA